MSIQADAQAQVIAAMKSHDDKRRDALRLIVNALKTESKEKLHDLSSDEEIAVLMREAKKRREAIEDYNKVGAADRAEKEAFELEIIQGFLPKQLSADEVRDMIKSLAAELNITSKKDVGKLMKALMPKIKGVFPGNEAKKLVDALELAD